MVKVITDENQIKEIFGRYAQAVFPSSEKALEVFKSGRRLTFYLGIDPTGPDIHLGHVTNFLVLKKIINLGHKVILLIGDFTARIGDPTGKDTARQPLSKDQVKENMKTYLSQVYKILPKGSVEIKYNSQWLEKMNLEKVIALESYFTVQQMMARDMFKRRLKEQKPISQNEFIYPLLQGYDSVAMEVDGEIGGNDQTFNMLIGRDLVKKLLDKEKIVIATKLLEDSQSGKKLMSKSEGQYISLNYLPEEIFGKVMALPDFPISSLFTLSTEISEEKLFQIEKRLQEGENPKNLKEELAFEIVRMVYGEKEAGKVKEEFKKVFSESELPSELEEFEVGFGSTSLVLLLSEWLKVSKSEAKRLVEQKAVKVNDKIAESWDYEVKSGDIIKAGPRNFVRVT